MGFAMARVLHAGVLALAVLASSNCWSQNAWPVKPVKIVVAFGPGGTADVLGRIIAAELSVAFNQQFYVENRPGNAGSVGSAQVTRADPDGYTLLIGGAGPHLTGPAVNPNIGYVTMRDFTHIAMIAGDSFMLGASNELGAKSFADLVKMARERPVTCGTPGAGSQGHLVVELVNRAAGIKLEPVFYRDAAENMTDLLGGHVDLAMQVAISVGEDVRAGKAVGLAVTSLQRHPVYPEIPTFAELGYPDIHAVAWFWLTGPKGIPDDIVQKLNLEMRRILKLPKVKAQFDALGLSTLDLDPAALNKFLANEVAMWGSLANEIGLRVQ
jgi:tripartite-type tricarboxylate transporter receptor subunit TctC